MNHNIKPLVYFPVTEQTEFAISRSWGNIKQAGTHPVLIGSLEEELKFLPECIIAIWKIKTKINHNANLNHPTLSKNS